MFFLSPFFPFISLFSDAIAIFGVSKNLFLFPYLDMSSATNNECNDPSIPIPRPTRNLPNIKRKDIFPNAKQIQPIKIGRHDIKVVAFLPMYSQIRAVQVILFQKLSKDIFLLSYFGLIMKEWELLKKYNL